MRIVKRLRLFPTDEKSNGKQSGRRLCYTWKGYEGFRGPESELEDSINLNVAA